MRNFLFLEKQTLKSVAVFTLAFFISNSVPVPLAFSDQHEQVLNEAGRATPTVTLEQANAKAETVQPEIPSGSLYQNESPLSLTDSATQDQSSSPESEAPQFDPPPPPSGLVHVYEGESIQAAIDSAAEGTTVFVHSGIYRQQVTLKQGVNLQGEDAGTTVIDGEMKYRDVIVALGNNRIENLTITGGRATLGETSSAIRVEGDQVKIRENQITRNLDAGIYIVGNGASLLIEENIFLGNNVAVKGAKTGNVIRYNTISAYTSTTTPTITNISYLLNQGYLLTFAPSNRIASYRVEYTDDGGLTWKRAQIETSPGVFSDQIVLANSSGATTWTDNGSTTSPGPLDGMSRWYRVLTEATFVSGTGIEVAADAAPLIQNNIITNQTVQSIWDPNVSGGSSVVEGNVLFNNADTGAHLPAAIAGANGIGWTHGNVLADPQFLDSLNGNYAVPETSPAYAKGAVLPNALQSALERASQFNTPNTIEPILQNTTVIGYRIVYAEGSHEEFYNDSRTVLDTAGPVVQVLSTVTITNQTSYTLRYTVDGVEKTEARNLAVEGDNALTIEVSDIFGNKTTQVFHVTRDTVPPAITVTSAPIASGSAYTLTWTVDGSSQKTRPETLQAGWNSLAITETDLAGNVSTILFDVQYRMSGHPFTIGDGIAMDSINTAFGTGSAYFSGTNSYINLGDHSDWAFGSGDFTIDFRARFSELPAAGKAMTLVSQWYTGKKGYTVLLLNDGGTYKLQFYYSKDGTSNTGVISGEVTLAVNEWCHIAVARSSSELKLYLNGTQIGSTFAIGSDVIFDTTVPLILGASGYGTQNPFKGWLDEVRISNLARFTSDFTPSPFGYSRDSNTQLLLHFAAEEFAAGSEMIPGEGPSTVSEPIVDATPALTNQVPFVLHGTKEAGTSIWINGQQTVAANADTTWSASYFLPNDGLHTLSILARDALGGVSRSVVRSVTLDTVPPAIVFTSPAVTNQADYILKYTVDGVEKTETKTLVSGVNNFPISATDAAGNITSLVYAVTFDNVPPVIAVTSTVSTLTNNPTLVVTYTVDGVAAQKTFTLVEGENATLSITAQDAMGNEATLNLPVIKLDTVKPVLTLQSSLRTGSTSYVLSYKVSDNVDSERVVTENLTLVEGLNTISRTVLDAAGNAQTVSWGISCISISTFTGAYDVDYVPYSWVVTTQPTGITSSGQTETFTLPFAFQFYGQNYNQIQVSDKGLIQFGACNNCSDYTPDSMPSTATPNAIVAPLWRDLIPFGGTITYSSNATQFVISWDNISNWAWWVYPEKQRFQLILNSDGSIIFQYAGVGPGPATAIGIENATGTEGIRYDVFPSNQTAIKFSLPMTGSISINQDAAYAMNRTVALNLSVASSRSAISSMRFSADNGISWTDWENFASTKTLTLPSGDGSKTVQCQFKDETGRVSLAFSDSIILDTVIPSGSMTINSNVPYANTTVVTLNLTGSDMGSGMDAMRFSTDGGSTWTDWENFAVTKSINLPAGDGTKEVRCQIRDRAGNANDFTDTITLDSTMQILTTLEEIRKVMILGPLTDSATGNTLTYSYTAPVNLLQNGQFSLLRNQLTYTPNAGFTGSGVITLQATGGAAPVQSKIFLTIASPTVTNPNDPSFWQQYGLDIVDAVRAWNLSRGTGITVAVIDSGIDLSHPDLDGNLYTNPDEIAGDGIDNDHNGYVDDIHGWDFEYNNNMVTDVDGHGTHVAGIIGAETNNGVGGAGIAPGVKLMSLQVAEEDVLPDVDLTCQRLAQAINYAVALGVRVINMSFGVFASWVSDAAQQVVRNAIAAACAVGVVFVASAGNENVDVGTVIPAAFDGVIAVSATNSLDQRATSSGNYFSNYGSLIDFSAPGQSVYSTYWTPSGSGYGLGTGTSMAAPFVAGLAALILAQDPLATYTDVYRRMKFSAKDLGTSGWDPYYGWGRIDAFQALSYDYYDNGVIKTQWLETPEEHGWNRLNFDVTGYLIGGSYVSPLGVGANLTRTATEFLSQEASSLSSSPFPSSVRQSSFFSAIDFRAIARSFTEKSKEKDENTLAPRGLWTVKTEKSDERYEKQTLLHDLSQVPARIFSRMTQKYLTVNASGEGVLLKNILENTLTPLSLSWLASGGVSER